MRMTILGFLDCNTHFKKKSLRKNQIKKGDIQDSRKRIKTWVTHAYKQKNAEQLQLKRGTHLSIKKLSQEFLGQHSLFLLIDSLDKLNFDTLLILGQVFGRQK